MLKKLSQQWYIVLLLLFAVSVPFLVPGSYIFQVITMSCIFAIATLSLNLILGYTGQVSLAHAAFFGIGGYGVAIMTKAGLSFWLALPLSALLAAFIGLLIGLPTLRTRGSYFAISTLCFGVIISIVAGNWAEVTGGYNGIMGIPRPTPIPFPFIGQLTFQSQLAQYYLVLTFLVLTIFVMYRLVYSPQGLKFMAVRNNENLANALGINPFAIKVISFVIANFFAGLAGGIYVSLLGSVSPHTASYLLTFNWLIYLLLGGVATIAGPILGALTIPILMEYLQFISEYRLLIFGALLIVAIIYFPRGLMGGLQKIYLSIVLKRFYGQRKAGKENAVENKKSNEAI